MSVGNLEYALEYIKRDWKIFPLFYMMKGGRCSCHKANCKRAGKHPTTRNGLQDASSDEGVVKQWWTENPWANIGLATGHDGVMVVDIDVSAGKVGAASLKALESVHSNLPCTLCVKTGSGGLHYYFISDLDIKNSQDVVGKHIDVRGHGGYVILPPSNHASGGRYEWATPIDSVVADMPGWLELLAKTKTPEIDISGDAPDANLQEQVKKASEAKLTAEQLIKLLDFIPADCDRDTWWQIGAALKKELGDERGWKVWNDWSSKAADKYDSKAAATHWASFVDKGITGGTIFHHAKDHGFRGFDTEAADTPEVVGQWLYAVSIKRFVDRTRLMELDAEQFNALYAPRFTRGKPADHVLKNDNFRRVDGVTYWPEKEEFVMEVGASKLNYWRPSGLVGAVGDVGPFLRHVEYLYPDPVEAGILLDYLAFQIQHPGEKVHWAILLQGVQGNGKSYFASVMRLVLGPHNVKMVHNDQLHETFTGWQRNTQLIIVEEMMARARLELMNKLKPMITEPWCTIREMYRPPYEQVNRFNFMFFSNHKDSIIIDNTDRRYCILRSDAPAHLDGDAYYGPLFDWTRRSGAELLGWFKERSLSAFQPKAHAPMTEGKRALMEQSLLPLDAFIKECVGAVEYPFQWDLVTPGVLVKPLADFMLRANPKDIGNAFARLGYLNLAGEDGVRMWAVRNFEVYSGMSAGQLRQVWLTQVNGTPMEPGAGIVDALLADGRGKNALKNFEAM